MCRSEAAEVVVVTAEQGKADWGHPVGGGGGGTFRCLLGDGRQRAQ